MQPTQFAEQAQRLAVLDAQWTFVSAPGIEGSGYLLHRWNVKSESAADESSDEDFVHSDTVHDEVRMSMLEMSLSM